MKRAWIMAVVVLGSGMGATARADEEPAATTPDSADARDTFAREAWRMERVPFMPGLSLPRGFGEAAVITDGTGVMVDRVTQVEAAPDPVVAAALTSVKRGGPMQWAWIGLSVTAVVLPVVLALPAAVLGGLVGRQVVVGDRSTTTSDLPSRLTPQALGAVVGAGLGIGAGAVAGVLVTGVVGALLGAVVPGRDFAPEAATVRAHNTALAKALGLDPATLPPQYFPTAR